MPNHHPSELNSMLSEDIAALRTERNELLDLLRDCHHVIDLALARVIELDKTFRPTQSGIWPIMERLSNVLRKNKRL